MFRVVLDANVYISAIYSPRGPNARLIEAARGDRITLLMCDRLLEEIDRTLRAAKARRYVTEDEAASYTDALTLLSEWFDDRPEDHLPRVCSDPADDYLIALAQDGNAAFVVSGDRAVQAVRFPNVPVYAPPAALEAIDFRHGWGDGLLRGRTADLDLHIHAEGHGPLLRVFVAFESIVGRTDLNQAALLPLVVAPAALEAFIEGLATVRDMLNGRGLGTRADFASPAVAYLKLPPDPGETIVSTRRLVLPDDTIYATLQRCPDLPDALDPSFDHWRVFAVGARLPLDQIPPA